MWTAVRLLAVCVLGISGLFVMRSGLPSHSPRQPPSAIQAAANDAAPVNPQKTEIPATVDENEVRIVTVEKIYLAALDANDRAPPEPEIKVHRQRHIHRHRWHRKTLRRH